MTACERNCNPVKCSEPVCEPGVRDKFESGQIANGCPEEEFHGNGVSQPTHIVTACRKETPYGIQRCQLPCAAGDALDVFVAGK